MTISGVVMILAALVFGAVPSRANARGATTAATPLALGTVVHAASCEQAPPQSAKDRATFSTAELARYGLPPRTPGEPFEKWAKIVRNAGERVCDYTIGASSTISPLSASPSQSTIWAGNVADESVTGQNYTEADMDFYVPCISGIPPKNDDAGMATWIGLGGHATKNMIQVGVRAAETSGINIYQVFVENTGGTDNGQHIMFGLSCGQHVYVKVWNGNCMYLQWLGNGENTGNQCYGPNNDGQSAEAIAERSSIDPYFANFGTVTLYGVGITDNGSYLGMNQVPHFYYQVYNCSRWVGRSCSVFETTALATVGPIQNDPGNPPYDQYAVTWHGYGTPWPS
jgi:hypothetical protein